MYISLWYNYYCKFNVSCAVLYQFCIIHVCIRGVNFVYTEEKDKNIINFGLITSECLNRCVPLS